MLSATKAAAVVAGAVVAETEAEEEVAVSAAVVVVAGAALAGAAVAAVARHQGELTRRNLPSSVRIQGFAKCLIQEKKLWRSNVRFPSSNPTRSRKM
jgi:hypothetical protein